MSGNASSCLTFPSAFTVSSPSSLSRPAISAFVTRNASKLYLSGSEWKAVGPNIYWLGLDENVGNTISYPSQSRVTEIFATAAAMGATAVRSTTLGVSTGHPLAIEPSLGVFNEQALRVVDFAVYTARRYGLRLIIPLTDQYAYYHGGKFSFLSFRNLSLSDPNQFFINADVVSDFKQYIGTLLNRTNTYTNISYARDPTILAWETGNELSPVPTSWTKDITSFIKALAPNQLTMDGSYGIQQDALVLPTVDMYSDHFYPLNRAKMRADASLVASAGKAFYVGEYDWTQKYQNLSLLACLIPLFFVAVGFCLPSRWFPWIITLPRRFGKHRPATHIPMLQPALQAESDEDISKRRETPPPTPDPSLMPAVLVRRRIVIKKWMFALSWLLLIPFAALIALKVGPTSLPTFLNDVENTNGVVGSAYWSLFGRDDACCQWIQHNDGFTLHYRDSGSLDRSFALTQHAYTMSRQPTLFNINDESSLPVITCPQSNGSTTST